MEANKKAEFDAQAKITNGTSFVGMGKIMKERTGKPPVASGESRRSLKSAYGINWEEEVDLEHPRSRSRFDAKFGTVYINKVHPDWTRKVLKAKDDFGKIDYYKLTIKEIVLHQYDGAPPADVLEKLLDLQLAMEKSPPSL